MKPTRQLHDLGQSVWLDNVTRELLDNGALGRYIEEISITALTSNPSFFDCESPLKYRRPLVRIKPPWLTRFLHDIPELLRINRGTNDRQRHDGLFGSSACDSRINLLKRRVSNPARSVPSISTLEPGSAMNHYRR